MNSRTVAIHSFILNFAYAEGLELKKDFAAVDTVFRNLLAVLRQGLEEAEAHQLSAKSSLEEASSQSQSQESQPDAYGGGPSPEEKKAKALMEKKTKELREKKTEYTLVYIMLMKSARRGREDGIKAGRTVFSQARKDRWIYWSIFESAGTSSCASDLVALLIPIVLSSDGVSHHEGQRRRLSHIRAWLGEVPH